MVDKVHIPFMPKIRIGGGGVGTELEDEIARAAKYYGVQGYEHKFSAKFEVVPDPRGKGYGHYLISEVVYHGREIELNGGKIES